MSWEVSNIFSVGICVYLFAYVLEFVECMLVRLLILSETKGLLILTFILQDADGNKIPKSSSTTWHLVYSVCQIQFPLRT